jgi:hypothetical protein
VKRPRSIRRDTHLLTFSSRFGETPRMFFGVISLRSTLIFTETWH